MRSWKIEEVFTPRRAEVNEAIYIQRDGLERWLRDAMGSALHVLIYGDSGCGKSWLYRKTFKDLGTTYLLADCANAARLKSFSKEFEVVVDRHQPVRKTGYTEKKTASVKIPVAEGGLEHEASYRLAAKEPFERILELLNKMSKNKPSVLVIDNLEEIVSDKDRMKELGNIITLCDNPDYAKYKVKLLIVGVPRDVRTYFSKTLHQETVANRLQELPEVGGLSKDGTHSFVLLGFNTLLRYDLSPETLKEWSKEIYNYTMGIPLRLHELCLHVATLHSQNRKDSQTVSRAGWRWAYQSMNQFRANIEVAMNERHTKTGRRNQVIYALGQIKRETFTVTMVEETVKREFPVSTKGRALGISSILAKLADMEHPIVASTGKGRAYAFDDKRYQMCIRCMLRKDGELVSMARDDQE